MGKLSAFEIYRDYGYISKETKFNLLVHYIDTSKPHSPRYVSKSVHFTVSPNRDMQILQVIEDSIPKEIKFRYVYTYIYDKRSLIFDDSSFITLHLLSIQFNNTTGINVFIDHCEPWVCKELK